MKRYLLIPIALLGLIACHNNANFEGGEVQSPEKMDIIQYEKTASEEPSGGADDNIGNVTSPLSIDGTYRRISNIPTKTPEMVIRNATINMRVEDYIKSRGALEKLILSRNAYISNENEQRTEYSKSNDVVIRVSNKEFAQLASDITLLGAEVNSRNMTAEDVGKTYFDLATRLKTKKEVEARYIELLKRANNIKDILEIENNIRVIREEIEAKEGEMKYLADQTAWSTIQVHFYQTLTDGSIVTDEPGFLSQLGSSLMVGWKGLQSFILGFMQAWPFWIILGLGIWFGVKGVRKLTRRIKTAPTPQTPSSQV